MITQVSAAIRLFVAFLLGGLIGLEREKKGRSAGLRTHILVCVGSTLFMLVSLQIYELYQDKANIDPARIAAGVVTGIGFLGAGTIIRSSEKSRGLTTAASVWVSSAIGLAVGCGYILPAVLATFIAFLTLFSLKRLEQKLDR
jgi:putative Mg2+ transporter-C (MgtC) family protein